MATEDTSPADSGYGNPYLDSLIIGNKWVGQVTYRFGTTSGQTWTSTEKQAFVAAFGKYSEVSGLTFRLAVAGETANLTEYEVTGATWNDTGGRVTLADHNPVGQGDAPNQTVGRYNTTHSSWSATLAPGGLAFSTIVHELGHAMGLDHPHDGDELFPGVTRDAAFNDLGDNNQNQAIWTVMSYNRGWSTRPDGTANPTDYFGHAAGLMAFDIAAIQALYGINWSTRTGNDVYQLAAANVNGVGWNAIWDGGGKDTISNAGVSTASVIDLRQAPLTGENAGGFASYVLGVAGGFTIANKAVIENAIGGGGGDTITGNAADNVLEGGAGADTITGGDGSDTASYRSSATAVIVDLNDATHLVGGDAQGDLLYQIENLIGSAKNDVLKLNADLGGEGHGLAGDDTVQGGSKNDVLRGGQGGDIFFGDAGDDTMYGQDSNLIRNGGFEVVSGVNLDVNGYSYHTPVEGWGVSPGGTLELFANGGGAGATSSGDYGVDLEGNQINTNFEISQTVSDAVDGQSYWLAFDVRKVSNAADAEFEVYWGGTKVDLTSAGATSVEPTTGWTTYFINVFGGVGTGGNENRLVFKEIGGGDTHGTLLDNVRLYRDAGNGLPPDTNDPFLDGNDVFNPGTGADTVFGHGGDDTASFGDVGPGDDHFDGGSGTDTLIMNWGAATSGILYGGLYTTTSTAIGAAESYILDGKRLFFKEIERFNLTGGTGNDTLRGGKLKDYLTGNGGDDTLNGGGGGDDINGGEGFDRAVVTLSGNGGNFIYLKDLQGAGTQTLADGTRLTSIEAIDLLAGDGDDFLDVRGSVVNAAGLPSTDPTFKSVGTYFEGKGGNDTLVVDLATSDSAYFDGGAGTRDLFIMDWSAATQDIFRDSDGSYKSYMKTVSVTTGGQTYSAEYFYTAIFQNVERFDLTGGVANDTLYGGALDDSITTIGGQDVARLGAGIDTLVVDYTNRENGYAVGERGAATGVASGSAAAGYDGAFAHFNSGDSITFSGVERFDLTLTAQGDTVVTGDGNDVIRGRAGDDTLNSGKGADTIDGGSGNDLWASDKSAMTAAQAMVLDLTLNGLQATYSVINPVTNVVATATVTDIEALTLTTGAGADRIATRYENLVDTVVTGTGADWVKVGGGGDKVDMGVGIDTLVIDYSKNENGYAVGERGAGVGVTSGTAAAGYSGNLGRFNNPDNVTFSGVERFEITLTVQGDTAVTGDGNDIIRGGGGNDSLNSGKGADIVDGGADTDLWVSDQSAMTTAQAMILDLTKSGLQATYSVTNPVTNVVATASISDIEAVSLMTGAADDKITTRYENLADTIATGSGADWVKVGGGGDTVQMGAGIDTLVIDYSKNENGYAVGERGAGVGVTSGTAAAGYSGNLGRFNNPDNVTFSGVERFEITLSAQGDTVVTGDGNDVIRGGAGGDSLNSGKGADTIDGGADTDRWISDQSAMISTQAMVLDLNATGIQATYSVTNPVTNVVATATVTGVEALTLTTGAGADRITTRAADLADTVATGNGVDWVKVAGGTDSVQMGAGIDTLVIDFSNSDNGYAVGERGAATGISGAPTADGYSGGLARFNSSDGVTFGGVEHFDLTLTAQGDTAFTGNGDDAVKGMAGDDTLVTGKGADTVDGGLGADRWSADKSAMTAALKLDLTLSSVQATYAIASEYSGIVKTVKVAHLEALGNGTADAFKSGSGNDEIVTRAQNYNDQVATGDGTDLVKVAGGSDWVDLGGNAAGAADTLVVDYSITENGYAVGERGAATGVTSGSAAAGYSGGFGRFNSNDNVTFIGAERFDLTLTAQGDTVVTGDGNDVIDGRGGADTMTGGGGHDTYVVDNAGDQVVEAVGGGADTVKASVSYALAAGQEVELLVTTNDAGKNAVDLTGNEFVNVLRGNAGANLLDGKGGIDTMTGYGGTDIYVVDNAADRVIEAIGGGSDTVKTSVSYQIASGQEVEFLVTTDETATTAIKLAGNEFANSIRGDAGANKLDGLAGADKLAGLGGDDTYIVDNSLDFIFEANVTGSDLVLSSVTYSLGGAMGGQYIEKLTLTGTAAIDATGNGLANTITGNGNANVIDGGTGADTLAGLGGSDTYIVDNSLDRIFESNVTGVDLVKSSVTYSLGGANAAQYVEALTLTGTTAINATGNALANTITGNGNANVIDGGKGIDTLIGGGGSDIYIVDNAGDKVIELNVSGVDTVKSSVSYTLSTSAYVEALQTTAVSETGAINLTGNNAAQTIDGNAGINNLSGLGGNDTLAGHSGNDTLTGGAGLDKFLFDTILDTATNIDTITDFSVVDDTIQLSQAIFAALGLGQLTPDAFWKSVAGTANDDSDRIIYDIDNGALFYDVDGTGEGNAIQFATVGMNLGLTSADFVVI